MEEKKEEKVRISVRNLVEFILREGDLDSRQGGTADKEGMAVKGEIELVMQRGHVIVKENQFLGKKGDGKYLKRHKSVLAE